MSTHEANEWFDDAEWEAAMQHLPYMNHRDFWRMFCMGGEL